MVHILIANRERYETNGMEWLLKSHDTSLNISHATSFLELQHKFESFPIDILIIEMELLSILEQEKMMKWIKVLKPKIVGLTIEATFEIAMKAIEIGVVKLLLKPVSPELLQKTVQAIVREIKSKNINQPVVKKSEKRIGLKQLFNDDETLGKDFVFLGIKTEDKASLNRLFSYVKDYSFQKDCEFYFLSEMLIGITQAGKIPWYDECHRFLRDWQLMDSVPISMVIFQPIEKNLSIHECYLETKKMLEVTFFIGYNQILQNEKAVKWRIIDPFLNSNEQKMWIDFLNQSNLTGLRDWLYREFLNFDTPYPDPGLIRIRLTSILAQIRRYMKENIIFQELEGEYLNLFNQVLYSTIIYRNVQELILFTSQIFNLKEQGNDQKKDIIENCLDYIKTHFWNSELSLEGIAAILNRNSTYLSSLFVQKTGKSFREALNEARITNAKKLLYETDMSIKEISALCGFTHQQYFTRVFRQKTSQTPNQYRTQKKL